MDVDSNESNRHTPTAVSPVCGKGTLTLEIEAMNGRLWFKSDEGVGTTFSFTLPLWREEVADSSPSAS